MRKTVSRDLFLVPVFLVSPIYLIIDSNHNVSVLLGVQVSRLSLGPYDTPELGTQNRISTSIGNITQFVFAIATILVLSLDNSILYACSHFSNFPSNFVQLFS